MGLRLFGNSDPKPDRSGGPVTVIEKTIILPNPNPHNFKIIKMEQIGHHVVAKINYPDCTTYGGNKVAVYEGISDGGLYGQGTLDPHFVDDKRLSPIARFPGDAKGWRRAIKFAKKCL
jgi:hypothetical protein